MCVGVCVAWLYLTQQKSEKSTPTLNGLVIRPTGKSWNPRPSKFDCTLQIYHIYHVFIFKTNFTYTHWTDIGCLRICTYYFCIPFDLFFNFLFQFSSAHFPLFFYDFELFWRVDGGGRQRALESHRSGCRHATWWSILECRCRASLKKAILLSTSVGTVMTSHSSIPITTFLLLRLRLRLSIVQPIQWEWLPCPVPIRQSDSAH